MVFPCRARPPRLLAAALFVACSISCRSPAPPGPATVAPRDVAGILRPGTVLRRAFVAPLGGRKRLVLWSQARPGQAAVLPPSYLDVYDRLFGGWRKIFDATRPVAPSGQPILDHTSGVDQAVVFLDPVDFEGRGRADLVVGVLSVGAAEGPLVLSVLAFDGPVEVAFSYRTQRGGTVRASGRTITLEAGVWRPDDPGCCPSAAERIEIGWRNEGIRVLSRRTLGLSPPP